MKHLSDQRGVTMFEVLVAMTSATLVIYSFIHVMNLKSELVNRVNLSSQMSEIMIANVNEAKTRTFKPPLVPDDCLVRYYDKEGEFKSEMKVKVGDSLCGKSTLKTNIVELTWAVTGPDKINVDFSNASLKLPHFRPSIVQYEIKGRVLADGSTGRVQELNAMVFRK